MIITKISILFALVAVEAAGKEFTYTPDWESLDKRVLPEWFKTAKIGIMVHWGLYSVPSIGENSESFWSNWKTGESLEVSDFMSKNYRRGFTYQDFAPMFMANLFDALAWARLFQRAGAKYVILTSKHHDGYTLFPSKSSFSWNSVDVGPHRDLVDELRTALKYLNIEFGVYYSLFEWYNPLYLEDKENFFATNVYVKNKVELDLKQLVKDYRPSVLWADGEWDNNDKYWNSTHFLAWLYNESPIKDKVVVNDRWGRGTRGKHGDFYTTWSNTTAKDTRTRHKWVNTFSLDKKSWGYRRTMRLRDVMGVEELLTKVVSTVSRGGNVLINVGATQEGTIPLIFQEVLIALGQFLEINGEAIHGGIPWRHENDSLNGNVWYTCVPITETYNTTNLNDTASNSTVTNFSKSSNDSAKADSTIIYATFFRWPANGILQLRDIANELRSESYGVSLIYVTEYLELNWKLVKGGWAQIELPDLSRIFTRNAWTLKFQKK